MISKYIVSKYEDDITKPTKNFKNRGSGGGVGKGGSNRGVNPIKVQYMHVKNHGETPFVQLIDTNKSWQRSSSGRVPA
jgi:hypothetical protein